MKSLRRAFLGLFLAGAAATPAAATWREARTKHFIIYSEQSPRELKEYAEGLERYDAAVRAVRSMEDPPLSEGAKLTIFILPTVAAVQKLAGSGSGGEGLDVYGFYRGQASGSLAFLSSARNSGQGIDSNLVFQHEYMHHLMLGDIQTPLPTWLIEGGAEFFGTAKVDKDGSVTIGAPPQVRAASVLNDMGFNAEQLVAGTVARTPEDRESIYGKGWLLSHYLTFAPDRKGQLVTYIKGLDQGLAPLDAGKRAFGDLKKLDSEMDAYGRRTFRALKISPGPAPAVTVREVSPGQNAIMNVRIRSDNGVNETSARQVVADARRIAASYPADAFVQGTLAETEFDVKDYAAAIAAADRALAVDPANVQALTYKGRALMELGRKDPAKADWAGIRSWLIKANRADTENAEPLLLFYESFKAAGQKPTKSAVEGLLYAQALAPQDPVLRFDAVRQLLADGRAREAATLFGVLIYNPHSTLGRQPEILSAMEKMKAGDSAGAILALAAAEKARAAAAAAAKS